MATIVLSKNYSEYSTLSCIIIIQKTDFEQNKLVGSIKVRHTLSLCKIRYTTRNFSIKPLEHLHDHLLKL